MVPTKDQFIPGGATHTPEELWLELFQNPAFRGLEIVDPPHFTCRQDQLPELEFCPVSFSFVDPAGETRARLLKKRRVWLFGQAVTTAGDSRGTHLTAYASTGSTLRS